MWMRCKVWGEIEVNNSQKELETNLKLVFIMQTVTEELDDEGRRVLRKLFGIEPPRAKSPKRQDKASQ